MILFVSSGVSKERSCPSSFLKNAFQLMRETDACGVMLETEKSNVIGNKLYQQLGFELIDKQFLFFRELR
jgi:ribosomal protein S18 acetylase RimI-like enzyme